MSDVRIERFMAKVAPIPIAGCWLWMGAGHPTGYGRFAMGAGTVDFAHRASYRLFIGEIPAGHYVCHRCDVRLCVNPAHLFAGTATDNMRDASAKGRIRLPRPEQMLRGERQPMAKLTDEQVREIRASSEPQKALAARFGVDPSTVSLVKSGRTWAGVE